MRFHSKNRICAIVWLTTILSVFAINAYGQNNTETETLNSTNTLNNTATQEKKKDTPTHTETINIHIHNIYDDHNVDTTYMRNRETFIALDSLMRDTAIINHTKIINVTSSSSIEGRESYNRALSKRRMHSIELTLRQRYDHIAADMWSFSYTPENWSHLRQAAERDTNLPNQEAVLSIINNDTLHPDTKESQLKKLDGGEPWSYITRHILPSSRGSASILFVPIAAPIAPPPTIIIDSTPEPPTIAEEPPVVVIDTLTEETITYDHSTISIRSNLLLDLTSTLNIAIEVPLAPRWSLSAEYITPWWSSWKSSLTWQIESLYFDVRYWLSQRESYNTLTGWSVGLYAGSGRYDLQPFCDKGVQGYYSDFGATVSYSHNLGRSNHWLMEYTASLGYVTTHYRHYYTADNTDEYGDIKVNTYPWSKETLRAPIPTRLGVTLCYLININKKGGER